MLKSVLMKNTIKFLKWVGEWLFVIFIFIPFFLFNLSRWKKETFNYDRPK